MIVSVAITLRVLIIMEKSLAKEKEKSLVKEKEKTLAKEKEKALAKEKEKQKLLAKQKQQAREGSFQPRSLLLKDVSVKEEEIGRGSTGIVSKVIWHGTECAAKSIHSALVDGTTVDGDFNYVKERFLEECSICVRLSHPNIVHFYGIFYPPGSTLPLLIMELMDSSLTKCIEKYSDIPLYMKLSFLHDISLGIRYLHSFEPPLVHRDLSTNNILITKGCVAKVGDLGVAKIIGENTKLTRAPGTLDFMPPEALYTEPVYDTPLDVFSYGGITIHCMSGEWPTPKGAVEIDPITRRVIGYSEQERRRGLIEKMGNVEQLKSLVIRCLDNLPEARPTMVEISKQVGVLKNKAIKSTPIAMMNMLDKDLALARSMLQSEKDTDVFTVPRLSSSASEEAKPLSPYLRAKTVNFKTPITSFTWQSCDALPQGMRSPKAVEHNGNIYVGGGDTGQDQSDSGFRVYVYNIARGKWSSLPPAPQHWFAMAIVEGKLLVVGGASRGNAVTGQVTSLDEAKSLWFSEYAPIPTSRSDPAAIGYQNHLIVIGGFDGRQSVDTVEVLDVSNNQWNTAASLPYTITSVIPILQDDVLYLAGGLSVTTNAKQFPKKSFMCTSIPLLLRSVLAGNVTSIWKELSQVPFSYSSTCIHDNSLYTFCGRDSSSKQDSSAIHLYDAVKNTWSQVGELPISRRMCAAISAATNGKLYVLGGSIGKVKCSDIVECSI